MPSFHDGNLLWLDEPPMSPDQSPAAMPGGQRTAEDWLRCCAAELADLPVQQYMIRWETQDAGEAEVWAHSGQLAGDIEYGCNTVLTLEHPPDQPPVPPGYCIRPVQSDAEWAALPALAMIANQVHSPEHARFILWQRAQHRDTMAEVGGHWWGVFQHDVLVASLGLLRPPLGLRFQEVETHPDHRRRGLCRALCSHALVAEMMPGNGNGNGNGGDAPDLCRAVIVAETGSQAERIYRRVGFAGVGLQHCLSQPVHSRE